MVANRGGSPPSGPGLEASPTLTPLYPHVWTRRAQDDPMSLAPGRIARVVPGRWQACAQMTF